MNKEQLEGMGDELLSLSILKRQCGGLIEKYSTSADGTAFGLLKGGCGSATISFSINSWADMGPLIDDIWNDLTTVVEVELETNWQLTMFKYKCGKLRAAAIFYILMQEG